MLISRLPPPRSTMHRGGASGPSAAMAASRPSRDSSALLITSREMPHFLLISRKKFLVAGLSRCAGSHGAIARHAIFFHHFLEVTKRLNAFFEDVFGEAVPQENTFAEAQ